VNNAVARIGSLLAIAVVPAAAGIAVGGTGVDLDHGFDQAMFIAAGLCVVGGVVAFFTIRRAAPVRTLRRGDATIPCPPPECLQLDDAAAAAQISFWRQEAAHGPVP
jgi:hypothetical protein